MRADPHRRRAMPGTLLLLGLSGCGGQGADSTVDADRATLPHATGDCAADPNSGALIGEIVGSAATPGGQLGYRVHLANSPGDTTVVGGGVRVIACAPARGERAGSNPEPVGVAPATPGGG